MQLQEDLEQALWVIATLFNPYHLKSKTKDWKLNVELVELTQKNPVFCYSFQ